MYHNKRTMNVLILGGSGIVGNTLINILETNSFPVSQLYISTSRNIAEFVEKPLDLHFIFGCVDTHIVEKYYKILLELNPKSYFIDNSSYFRLHAEVDIIIPPINKHLLSREKRIISNSNCTTSGLVMCLAPIHALYNIMKIRITSFQSMSGVGFSGLHKLNNERNGGIQDTTPIYNNLHPYISQGKLEDVSPEEYKLMHETCKLLNDSIDIYATCVRCPIENCHSLSVDFTLNVNISVDEIKEILKDYVIVKDIVYPLQCVGEKDVFISRLRKSNPKEYHCFITFDNLYRGASYNSYEIATALLGIIYEYK